MANLIVIEDDERVAEVINIHLTRRGHTLHEARSGEDGLELVESADAQAVILDIRLPGMSGVEVLDRIRQRPAALPVIVLTGQVDVDLAVDVMKRGAFDFLTKPIKTANLVATVEKALAYKRLLDENARLLQENGDYQRNLERMVEQRTRELQESQDRLLLLRNEMSRMDQMAMVGKMASAMAHEVKNPVVGVQGYSELLLMRGDLDDEVKEAFETILHQCHRVSQILTEFLNVTRPPAPQLVDTDLTATIEEIVRLTRPHCLFRAIKMVAEVGQGQRCEADASQLQQVLLNLIMNACHAMPDGGELRVSLSVAGGTAEIAIADTGVGIPEDQLDRIFGDFFTTKERSSGTGLGLAIARDIVERHGGTIEVESRVGAGTTFRVLLPQTCGVLV